MRVRIPLYAQALLLLCVHLAVLTGLFLILFNSQGGFAWDAIMRSPLGDRLQTTAWVIARQLEARPKNDWNNVLQEFGKTYGVKYSLFDVSGKQLAGEPVQLPAEVGDRVNFAGGDHHFAFGPKSIAFGVRTSMNDHLLRMNMPPAMMPPPGAQPGPFHSEPGPPQFGAVPGMPFHVETGPPQFGGPPPMIATLDGLSQGEPPPPEAPPPHLGGRFILHSSKPDLFWLGAHIPLFDPETGMVYPATLFASCGNLLDSSLLIDFRLVYFVAGTVLLLSITVWFPFAFRLTQAMSKLTRTTEQIADGKFDVHLHGNDWDEIGSLSQSVNTMSGRLNKFVSGQKRFLGDIAHELCSPLARLQIALELLDGSSDPAQKQTVKDIREEVEEMTMLVNELLAFSKAGLSGQRLDLEPINLRTTLESVVAKTCTDSEVTLDVAKELWVLADEVMISRAFSNVLRNCVRYAGTFGPIEVKALHSGAKTTVSLLDRGPGVPPDALQYLGEPFYRPEASRNRSSGGFGLGLAIVKTCVETCDGTLAVRNRQSGGLAVEISLTSAAPVENEVPVPSKST